MELIADTQVMSSHSYLDTNQQLNKGEQKWLTTGQIQTTVYVADDIDDCSWQKDTQENKFCLDNKQVCQCLAPNTKPA